MGWASPRVQLHTPRGGKGLTASGVTAKGGACLLRKVRIIGHRNDNNVFCVFSPFFLLCFTHCPPRTIRKKINASFFFAKTTDDDDDLSHARDVDNSIQRSTARSTIILCVFSAGNRNLDKINIRTSSSSDLSEFPKTTGTTHSDCLCVVLFHKLK